MNVGVRSPLDANHPVGSPRIVDWRTDTLVGLLVRRAAETPDMVLYTFLEDGETRERSITAAELDATARRIGQTLARFAEPGDRAVLLFEDGLDAVAGLFGCLHAGLVAVSGVHPAAPRATERLLGILRDCQATIVLGQARVLAEFQRALDDVIDDLDVRWVASDAIRPARSGADDRAWRGPAAANGDLALLQYTSGSSREPRGVMLSHRNVLHNLSSQFEAFGCRPGDTGVSWLPFSHDMGLIGCVLLAVYGGGRCVLLAPSHFLEDPLRWVRAISRYRATMSAAPNFAYDLCARRAAGADLAGLDLSCWDVAVSGAEPIRAEAVRRFASVFEQAGFQANAIHPSYGLAEATLLVTTGSRMAPLRTGTFDRAALQANLALPSAATGLPADGTELVDCGTRRADQRLAIVDPTTGQPLPPDAIGEIWIAGPSVSEGYFGRPDENAALFAADLGDGFGPYYRTGDLGFLRDDALFVTGRLRDLLIIRGKNYYPQDLELTVEASHPAIRPGCSACFQEDAAGDLVVVAEIDRGRDADAADAVVAIRDAIVRDHGVNPRTIVLTGRGSAFKTPSGKIQRALTRTAYAEGRIAIVHESIVALRAPAARRAAPVDPANVEDWVLKRMRDMGIDVAAFDSAMRLTDLGFDSLKIVELKADMEQDLGIAINIADLYAFQNLASLVEHLRALARRERDGTPTPPVAVAAPRVPPRGNRLAEQRQRRAAATAGGPIGL